MRPSYGTNNSTASSVASILYTGDTNTRMFSVSFKARAGNPSSVYIGSDSNVVSSAGYELVAGSTLSFIVSDVQENNVPGTIKAHIWHMSAPSTVSKLDWAMLLET